MMPMATRQQQLAVKLTAKRLEAVPLATCPDCLGSGFVDTIDPATGEVLPMLCHRTPACKRHAERARAWFTNMLYWWGIVTEASLNNGDNP